MTGTVPDRAADGHPRPGAPLRVRALLLAERIDTRRFEQGQPLGTAPLVVRTEGGGRAALMRYGVVALFGVPPDAEQAFLRSLSPYLFDRLPAVEAEEIQVFVSDGGDDQVDASGNIHLADDSTMRLQLLADVLAKNLVLAHYEIGISAVFDRMEPLAATIKRKGVTGFRGVDLLRQMGDVLLTQHRMVGRVEVLDKPELLWEHPELERLYARLETEYELRDRARALERKLELISRTSEMLLGILQSKRSLRVEWYVVILIVIEILLSIYSIVAPS